VSALLLSGIRAREPVPVKAAAEPLRSAVWAGIALVIRHPALRAVMTTGALLMLFETAWTSIQPVFLIRTLGLAPAQYGALLAVGAAGGLAGALSATRIIGRVGTPNVMRLALATTTPFILIMPFAQHDERDHAIRHVGNHAPGRAGGRRARPGARAPDGVVDIRRRQRRRHAAGRHQVLENERKSTGIIGMTVVP
jgi:hypothetical protein